MLSMFTKAQRLMEIKGKTVNCKILDGYIFTVREWRDNKKNIIQCIQKKFHENLIVRSSTYDEDLINMSNAGHYVSKLNVDYKSKNAIEEAINDVINSYNGIHNIMNCEVFVQQMLNNVIESGVILTYDIENNLPYYVISANISNSDTSAVTSGVSNDINIRRILRGSSIEKNDILKFVVEIEQLMEDRYLDLEYAKTNDEEFYLLQVRRIVIKEKVIKLGTIHNRMVNCNIQNAFIVNKDFSGTKVVYSNMTDWNPAELISKHPKPLDYSMYNNIFTNKAWSIGRSKLGYKRLKQSSLTKLFWGYAYVDICKDFNSYLPEGLENNLESKIIDFYIEYLQQRPQLYDKVEFEVVDTCYTVDIEKRKYRKVLDEKEINIFFDKLIQLTNNIINDNYNILDDTINEFDKMISNNILNKYEYSLKNIQALLDFIINKLAVYYATIVRAAFIGYKEFLDLQKKNYITKEEFDNFFCGINTITSMQIVDANKLKKGEIKIKEFKAKYSCVRENMFDICSNSKYDSEQYIMYILESTIEMPEENSFKFKNKKIINNALKENNLNFDIEKLCEFTKKTFYYREQIKYYISKGIMLLYKYVKRKAKEINVTVEDIAFISISDIIENWDSSVNLKRIIEKNKKLYNEESKIILPDFIGKKEDFFDFTVAKYVPNFITGECIEANLVLIDEEMDYGKLEGKILLIEKADPGYDWVFNCGITGLITQYGGVASHMSLRAHELKIPAAIGCGGTIFNKIKKGGKVRLDCKNKRIYLNENCIYK